MKNEKWSREFPEVPENVHQSVLNALARLDRQEAKKMKRRKKRTIVILAAAMVAVLGTTAAASGIFAWNERAQEVFEAEPKVQDQLVLDQVAQPGNQEVTDNGLTVRALQTLQDSYCFYALFEVTALDPDIRIDENCGMDYWRDCGKGEDPFSAMTWGFVGEKEQEVSNSRYFEIFGTKMEEGTEELNMDLHFTALTGPAFKAAEGEPLIEGNWDFSISLHPAEPVRHEVNRQYRIAGQDVQVFSVELSPLTMKIVCSGEDIRSLQTAQGVDFNQLDTLRPMLLQSIKYQDGTEIPEQMGMDLVEGFDGNGDYYKVIRMQHVIEPQKVSVLVFGDQRDEVELE